MSINKLVTSNSDVEEYILESIDGNDGQGSGINATVVNGISSDKLVLKTEIDEFIDSKLTYNDFVTKPILSYIDDINGNRVINASLMRGYNELSNKHLATQWQCLNSGNSVIFETINDFQLQSFSYISSDVVTKIRARFVVGDGVYSLWSDFLESDPRLIRSQVISASSIDARWTPLGLHVDFNQDNIVENIQLFIKADLDSKTYIVICNSNGKQVYKKEVSYSPILISEDLIRRNEEHTLYIVKRFNNTNVILDSSTITVGTPMQWKIVYANKAPLSDMSAGLDPAYTSGDPTEYIYYTGKLDATGATNRTIYSKEIELEILGSVQNDIYNNYLFNHRDTYTKISIIDHDSSNLFTQLRYQVDKKFRDTTPVSYGNDKYLLIGGEVNGSLTDKIYDHLGNNVGKLSTVAKNAAAVVVEDKYVIILGGNNGIEDLDKVWVLNTETYQASECFATLPFKMSNHSAVYMGYGLVMVYTTLKNSLNESDTGILFSFNYLTGEYKMLPTPPTGLKDAFIFGYKENIFITGGVDNSGYISNLTWKLG